MGVSSGFAIAWWLYTDWTEKLISAADATPKFLLFSGTKQLAYTRDSESYLRKMEGSEVPKKVNLAIPRSLICCVLNLVHIWNSFMKVYFCWQYTGAAGLWKEIGSSGEMTWLAGQARHRRIWSVLSNKLLNYTLVTSRACGQVIIHLRIGEEVSSIKEYILRQRVMILTASNRQSDKQKRGLIVHGH